MKILGTLAFGIAVDILLWPVTKQIWSELIHKVLLEQARDTDLAYRTALYVLDLGMALALIAGIGFLVAAACVQTVASALSRR